MFMTAAGFIILLLLGLLGVWLFWEFGGLPGKKARERNHPQADAIAVAGWLGLLFGGVGWALALVWAHTTPVVAVVQAGATPAQVGKAVEEAVEKARETSPEPEE